MTGSGDRHLRSDPGVRLGDVVAGDRFVRVEIDPALASTFAGQATLSLLVDLLARQFEVIGGIGLAVPAVPAHARAFPRAGRSGGVALDETLADLVARTAGGEIGLIDPKAAVDLVVRVGPGPADRIGRLGMVTAFGHGWSAFCSTKDEPPMVEAVSTLAFGPHLAAALAADRVFRALHGVDAEGTFAIDLFAMSPEFGSGPSQAAMTLPAAYVIGLGAVGAAAIYTLSASEGIGGVLVGMDDDTVDDTSRNRLLSADHDDVGSLKSDVARRLLAGSGIEFHGNTERFRQYLIDPDRNSPAQLRTQEPFRFEYVLSFVDKNEGRNEIAAVLPRHTISGSTDGLRAESTYYSAVGACECLACNHPAVSPDHDVLVAELRPLPPGARDERLQEMGASRDEMAAIADYLADPACGVVGEAALRRLGINNQVRWAVGFVSAAAGIAAAARFARLSLDGPPANPEARLYFLKAGSMSTSTSARKSDCRVCGHPDAERRFARRWGGNTGSRCEGGQPR